MDIARSRARPPIDPESAARASAGQIRMARASARALAAIRAVWPGPRPCPGPDVLLHYESPSSQDNNSEKGFAEGARIDHCLDSL